MEGFDGGQTGFDQCGHQRVFRLPAPGAEISGVCERGDGAAICVRLHVGGQVQVGQDVPVQHEEAVAKEPLVGGRVREGLRRSGLLRSFLAIDPRLAGRGRLASAAG